MKPALLFAILFLASFSHAARIWGFAYDASLDPVARAIIAINGTAPQRLVTQNGSYQFLVVPGTYHLEAFAVNLSASQDVSVGEGADARLDLILLPAVSAPVIDPLLSTVGGDVNASELDAGRIPAPSLSLPLGLAAAILLVLALACAGAWLVLRARRSPPATVKARKARQPRVSQKPPAADDAAPPASRVASPATEDQRKVVKVLGEFNGRASQKELRKALAEWSEAKVSMELTELEESGIIRKIRKGRGNIIRLA